MMALHQIVMHSKQAECRWNRLTERNESRRANLRALIGSEAGALA